MAVEYAKKFFFVIPEPEQQAILDQCLLTYQTMVNDIVQMRVNDDQMINLQNTETRGYNLPGRCKQKATLDIKKRAWAVAHKNADLCVALCSKPICGWNNGGFRFLDERAIEVCVKQSDSKRDIGWLRLSVGAEEDEYQQIRTLQASSLCIEKQDDKYCAWVEYRTTEKKEKKVQELPRMLRYMEVTEDERADLQRRVKELHMSRANYLLSELFLNPIVIRRTLQANDCFAPNEKKADLMEVFLRKHHIYYTRDGVKFNVFLSLYDFERVIKYYC